MQIQAFISTTLGKMEPPFDSTLHHLHCPTSSSSATTTFNDVQMSDEHQQDGSSSEFTVNTSSEFMAEGPETATNALLEFMSIG